MGCGAVAQLLLGFREGDVEAFFARPGAFQKELQGQGRLAGTGWAFEQEQPTFRQPTMQDVVEAGDPDWGLGEEGSRHFDLTR